MLRECQFNKNRQLLSRATKVTPLGAQTYSKSYRYYCGGAGPCFIKRGKGNRVWDVDGNKYIDFECALGPVIVGYNDKRINRVIKNQLNKGIVFSQPHPVSVLLSEKIVQIIPCVEKVRFVKNGSDATSAAVRLARAYTGRDKILACGYHGMQDWYIGCTDNNKGVPKAVRELTYRFKYNDIKSIKELFEKNEDEIAAVILEPIQSNGPKDNFLAEVKELTHKNGAILIFDEVKSGFWFTLGGASQIYGVHPDMITFGKALGNGMPISAVGGRKELIELIETKKVFVSTTFGGEALSMTAALKTIEILSEPNTYEKIWNLGSMMLEGLKSLIEKYSLGNAVKTVGLPPFCGLIFNDIGNLSYLDLQSVYQQTMIENGILTLGINHINLALSKKDVIKYLESSEKAFAKLKRAVNEDYLDGLLYMNKINPVFKRN